jgi:transcriptional regulator with XRE-family HTH domain
MDSLPSSLSFLEKLLKKLKHLRKTQGFTIRDMANLLHSSKSVYQRLEEGTVPLEMRHLFQICEVLDVDTVDLLNQIRAEEDLPPRLITKLINFNALFQ